MTMPPMTWMLKQKAVYWPPGLPGDDGQPTYEEPVEVRCRWDDIATEIRDYRERTVISNTTVMVDREMAPGGVLWQGELQYIQSQTEPFENTKAFEILKFAIVPQIDAKKALYMAML